jgi:hypothetical protein
VKPVEDHNDGRWLEIAYFEKRPGRQSWSSDRFQPGWYVVRRCPCHDGEPVTLALPNEWAAWRAKRMMLSVTAARQEG